MAPHDSASSNPAGTAALWADAAAVWSGPTHNNKQAGGGETNALLAAPSCDALWCREPMRTVSAASAASSRTAGGAAMCTADSFMDVDDLIASAACKPGWSSAAADSAGTNSYSAADSGRCPTPVDAISAAAAAVAPAGERAAALAAVMRAVGATPLADGRPAGVAAAAAAAIAEYRLCDTFYIYDLGEVARLHAAWCAAMPRVEPFYAVKCNPEPNIIAALAALGAGFDCASVAELQAAAAAGVPQERIIFANPCKRPGDFRYAKEAGVRVTTFDTASELHKIADMHPGFACVLRIRCDDEGAKINLGLKYGADDGDVPGLLALAKSLGLQVVGVSFHVGSGCANVRVYADAIAAAAAAFDTAEAIGFAPLTLLDIGGGFTAPHDAASAALFYETAAVVNDALQRHFPPSRGVRIIAEPGRYFAETSATLFTTILGQRRAATGGPGGGPFHDYWLSDGTYGSFRIQVAVDRLEPTYSVLRSPLLPAVPAPAASAAASAAAAAHAAVSHNYNNNSTGDLICTAGHGIVSDGGSGCYASDAADETLVPCRLWGSSDRIGDVVVAATALPPLRDGDWLAFPAAGAYTVCAASCYGGAAFAAPSKLFVCSTAGASDPYVAAAAAAAAAAASAAAACIAPEDASRSNMLLLGESGAECGSGGGGSTAGLPDSYSCCDLQERCMIFDSF